MASSSVVASPKSLVPETLAALAEEPQAGQAASEADRRAAAREERAARRRALHVAGLPAFGDKLEAEGGGKGLVRASVEILQVNVGLYCNQACSHCHVESSPLRKEALDERGARRIIELLRASPSTQTLDLTGGAPEYNPYFRYLVEEATQLGVEVIDRCNLTVLCEEGMEDMADFLAEHKVRVVASLPCYSAENVDAQRGRGVFDRSIRALRELNARGYGDGSGERVLDLVYNPGGAFLPPPQASLQEAYKSELEQCYGVRFDSLLALTNMPIKRFADHLAREGKMKEYMELLVDNFNVAAAKGVMCTNTISVSYDGSLYDCDFNQQLGIAAGSGAPKDIFELQSLGDLQQRAVALDAHCFGCTAGAGSSCQGATA